MNATRRRVRLASPAGAGGALHPDNVRRLAVPTVLLAALGVAGVLAPGTWPFEMTFGVVQALLALSVGMLFGRAGLLMLCPFAFAAISVWVVLWFNIHTDLPFAGLLVVGALSAVPAGVLVGGLALRVRGVNLAVVTLAFAAAVTAVFSRHSFPGTLDAVRLPVRPELFKTDTEYYVLAFLILVATGLALEWLGRRPFGQAWRAVRSSERATAAAGLSVPRVKLSAFVTSACIAGIAGAVYAGQLEGSVDIRSFSPLLSLAIVAAAIMFGAQSLSGAVVAGFLGALIPVVCRRNGWAVEYPQILFGLGAVHALSQGGGGISSTFPWRRPIRSRREAPETRAAAEPAGEGGPPVLEVEHLTVRYGALTALDDVSISVPEGAVVGIIGPNGAGKSTLIDAVTGYIAGYSGSIRLRGRTVDRMSATRRARAGLRRTFQQGRAIPELNVGDYVNLYAKGHIDPATMDEVLGFFGLPPADEPVVFVDVGTRRILEVAAAVASRPVVAFLDEPAAGLGSDEAVTLARHIKEIPSRFGCSVVLIEHNIELVAEVCSHITVLDFGLVIADGHPEQVLADPLVAAAYLGQEIEHVIGESVPGGGS
jgi:branched-chain amino acid transport system permease protein